MRHPVIFSLQFFLSETQGDVGDVYDHLRRSLQAGRGEGEIKQRGNAAGHRRRP